MESRFQQVVVASGVVDSAQWEYCLRLLRHRTAELGEATTPERDDLLLKDILVEQGAVTQYQAEQLAAGRHKLNLGPYVITDSIGQGGMGHVFKGVHQVMGRECAVKVLPLQKATEEAREAFIREIRLQAKLDYQYLVRAYDAGQDGKIHYLVTEYVPGMDLRRLIKAQGYLSQVRAAKIVRQAALGLEYAHQQGMVHRDVKPGNILVTPDGEAKVSDVGLASFTANLNDDPRAGKIVGTADYLSPEQIRTPLEVGPVSDVYSLGCTLYYAVCGKVPFPGGDTASKIRRHLEETPMHPRRFAEQLQDDFVDIIAEMMEKDFRKRIQTCAEVASRLEPWADMESRPVSYPAMSKDPWAAPPPPAVEDPFSLFSPEREMSTDNSLLFHESSASVSGLRSPPLPTSGSNSIFAEGLVAPNLPTTANTSPIRSGAYTSPSTGLTIALTAAILVPPTLLLGAIIGYLIATRL